MLASMFCEIPMSVLTAPAGPFALPLGRLIQAKVAARNSVGLGAYSALNTAGVLAQTAPLKPASPPQRNAASTQYALVLDYPFAVTPGPPAGYEDGDSTILSLNLQWDRGTAGATWATLLGESPHSTTDSYTVQLASDGSDAGKTYKFRARAYNAHGWGALSDEVDVLAADYPAVIASTTIELVDDVQVQFSWQSPEPNGSPIDAYKVEILSSTGSYLEETAQCSGAVDPTVSDPASCRLPMAAFSADPWNLAPGSPITFRVAARNQIGWQAVPSSSTTGLVPVETAPPGAPAPLVLDASQTNEGQIRVTMPEILDSDSAANGGSAILSYSLEWDSGFTGTGFTALTGAASDNLELARVVAGLSAGAAYEFRYRVRNVYGWGDYSPVLAAIAATPPATPA